MGPGLSKEDKTFIKEHGFTKAELTKLKKMMLAKGATGENLELTKDQFKELFVERLGPHGRSMLDYGGQKVDLDEICKWE